MSAAQAGAVAARILSAVVAGYALAYTATAFLSVYLPMSRPDRVSLSSLACFIVWVAGAHAAAALFHHFVLRDRVLVSMLPVPATPGDA